MCCQLVILLPTDDYFLLPVAKFLTRPPWKGAGKGMERGGFLTTVLQGCILSQKQIFRTFKELLQIFWDPNQPNTASNLSADAQIVAQKIGVSGTRE